jgi:hypothetical protein
VCHTVDNKVHNEEYHLLECNAKQSGRILSTFRRNMLHPSSGSSGSFACDLLLAGFYLGLLFASEDGGSTSLRNFGEIILDYMESHPQKIVLFKTESIS